MPAEQASSKRNDTSSTASSSSSETSTATAVEVQPKAAAAKKQRKLGYYEQQEYSKLAKQIDVLSVKRDKLNEQVMKLAQDGSDLQELEKASLELGKLAEDIDAKSDRWMELAEIAGDI